MNVDGSQRELYHELLAYTLSHPDPAFIHQYVVDVFAAQTVDASTRSDGHTARASTRDEMIQTWADSVWQAYSAHRYDVVELLTTELVRFLAAPLLRDVAPGASVAGA